MTILIEALYFPQASMTETPQNNENKEIKKEIPKQEQNQDIFLQKQQELGRTPEQTKEVKDCFLQIQKEFKQPIDDYIKTINSRIFIKQFGSKSTAEEKYTFSKEKVIRFFEEKGVQLIFTTYNSLQEEENKAKEEENKAKEEENKAKEEENKAKNNISIKSNNINETLKITGQTSEMKNKISEISEHQKIVNLFAKTEISTKTIKDQSLVTTSITESKDSKYDQQKQEIKQKLQEKGFNEQETNEYANDYVTYQILQKKLPKSEQNSEFLSNFKELKSTLGIIDDIGDIGENKDLAQNTQNILKNYPSVADQSQKENKVIDDISIPAAETENFFSEEAKEELKKAQENIQKKHPNKDLFEKDSFSLQKDLKISQEEAKDFKEYNDIFNKNIQETLQKQEIVKQAIKQQITVTPIIGISKYLDSNNGEINFDNDFNIKGNKSVRFEDGSIHMSGTINNHPIFLEQNLESEELSKNQLKVNDSRNISYDGIIKSQENTMKSIGVILPNQQVLNQRAKQRTNKNLQDIIKNNNSKSLQKLVNNQLGTHLLNEYKYEDIVKERLSSNIQKNLTKQDTLNFLEKNLGRLDQESFSKDKLKDENFKITKGIIKGIENLSPQENAHLSQNLQKVQNFINKIDSNKTLQQDPILKNFTQDQSKITKENRDKDKSQKNPVLNLLSLITKDTGVKQEIQIKDFDTLINKREKNEAINGSENALSDNFKKNFEESKDKSKEADDYLKNHRPN